MTKILIARQGQIASILSAWNQLDAKTKQDSINLVMPLTEGASLFSKISPHQSLEEELRNFRHNYEEIYGKDIDTLSASDFSPSSMELLEKIYKLEQISNISVNEKRQLINAELKENNIELTDFRKQLLDELDHKYQHAHARISFQYGKLADAILNARGGALSEKFDQLKEIENEQEFFSTLVDLIKEIDIPGNFDLLKESFGIDGIEEHTAINQGTLYRANLDNSELIHEIENFSQNPDLKTKAQEFFTAKAQLKSIKIDTTTLGNDLGVTNPETLRSWQQDYRDNVSSNAKLTAGLEIEFLLLPFGGPQGESERYKSDFEKLIKGTADLDSRKKMRENYGFPHDQIAHTPNVTLLFSQEELGGIAAENREVNPAQRQSIKDFLSDASGDQNKIDHAIKNIDLLSPEEVFFFDLLFLHHEEAVCHKIVIDGIFDFEKTLEENLNNILDNIANRASFYPQTLDMIRAHEISVGPFEFSEIIEEKNRALRFLKDVSASHGLRAKDRDVQINIGAAKQTGESLLKINADVEKNVSVDQSTKEILNAIQKGLLQAVEDHSWIARGGQKTVGIAVDRKKGFNGFLKDTPYYKSYEEESHLPDSSAFPVHRDNTGKSQMGRLARINQDLAVVELRLIGNNTHVPNHDESVRLVFNGIEILPEIILPYLIKEIKTLGDLSLETGQVKVGFDGLIESLPPLEINASADAKPNPLLTTIKEKPAKALSSSHADISQIF